LDPPPPSPSPPPSPEGERVSRRRHAVRSCQVGQVRP
jgi:hypothetical protein